MDLLREDKLSESLSRVKSEASTTTDDGQQWEDFTRVGSWEELIGCVEGVLREWSCSDADGTLSNDPNNDGTPSRSNTSSRARCLEHDGQLFSITLVSPSPMGPRPSSSSSDNPTTADDAQKSATAATSIGTTSRACDIGNRSLDFAPEGLITAPQRWFGLREYVLVRGLGRAGGDGISDDQLLWAATVAAASCKCSIPVLVSCDWDGSESEEGGDEGGGGSWEGGGGTRVSLKGYSAPGSKGTACSVWFQTAWTDQSPLECLYLDGLTELFLSKIKDAYCLPGRAFAPRVSTAVQHAWHWTKPQGDTSPPAPGLRRDGTSQWAEWRSDSNVRGDEGGVIDGDRGPSDDVASSAGGADRVENNISFSSFEKYGRMCLRREAMGRLLLAVGGEGDETTPLWGPDEDPLEAICVRVRWPELKEGLVEESRHYTTLEPLPEEEWDHEASGSSGVLGGSKAHWFVSARWRQDERRGDKGNSQRSDGRLAEACSRLLAALVLATRMHPGTLMADLGASSGPDSPMTIAEDYGKAAADMLSAETKASVEILCSNSQSPPIDHDRIDLLLRDLLHPQENRCTSSDGGDTQGQGAGEESWAPDMEGVEVNEAERDSSRWWAWAGRGGAPVGRLLSLLSLRMAECDDVRSMALLWMSFVRDIRLLWEDGATIARMVSRLAVKFSAARPLCQVFRSKEAVPVLDGTSMFDRAASGTRQSESVAARLRGDRAWLPSAHSSEDGLGGAHWNSNPGATSTTAAAAAAAAAAALDSGEVEMYPDTRMCLVWQKLQMLDCCRVRERGVGLASGGGVDAGLSKEGQEQQQHEEEGEEVEGEENGDVFYDTREYDQPWEGEDDGQEQNQDGDDEGNVSVVDDGPQTSVPHNPGEEDPASYAVRSSVSAAGPSSAGAEEIGVETGGGGSDLSPGVAATPSIDERSGSEVIEATDMVGRVEEGANSGGAGGAGGAAAAASPRATVGGEDVEGIVEDAGDGDGDSQTIPLATVEPGRAGAVAVTVSEGDGNVGEVATTAVAEDIAAETDATAIDATATGPSATDTTSTDVTAADATATDVNATAGDDVSTGPRGEGLPRAEGVNVEGEMPLTVAPDAEAASTATAAAVTMAVTTEELEELGYSDVTHINRSGMPTSVTAGSGEGKSKSKGKGKPRLLRTGATVCSPRLQSIGPMTGDMLEQQKLGQAGAYRERAVLRADMEAFLRENPGAVFADFVRWYRPECWKDAAGVAVGELPGASIEKAGDGSSSSSSSSKGAEDDRRLAWPEQGQVLWKNPDSSSDNENASEMETPAIAVPSSLTLAGWLSCWREAAVELEEHDDADHVGERWRARSSGLLFNPVKEGEKALHYLETVSPGPLLLQLLSALLGLSSTLLQETASSSANGLPATQEAADAARRKVTEAVELLAATTEAKGPGGRAEMAMQQRSRDDGPLLPFPQALLAADAACLEIKRAETALARAVSLQRSLPAQKDLVNAIVACEASGVQDGAEAPVVKRKDKEFLRDLLLAQDMGEAARYGKDENGKKSIRYIEGGRTTMPIPQTKECVLRCQTPAPFYERNLGRGQMEAYPTPPSRMYAKTDGQNLRVAVSICESDV